MRLLISTVAAGLVALLPMGVEGASFSEVARSARADLEEALAELTRARRGIADEKLPLARRLNEVEQEVVSRRQELERAERARDNQLVDLNVLKAEVKRREDENQYLTSLLSEYARVFETRVHISQLDRYQPLIRESLSAIENPDLASPARFDRQLSVIDASLERLNGLIGGDTFEGKALSPDGVLEEGRFALVGPLGFFANGRGTTAGLASLPVNSAEATVIEIGQAAAAGIRELVSGGTGEVPVDPTLGNALKLAGTKDSLAGHIRKGGVVMVPILLLGFTAFVVGMVKWAQISRIREAAPKELEVILSHLRQGERSKASEWAGRIKGPVGEMLNSAIRHVGEKKEYIEEVMYEKMLITKPRLERLMPVIALTAATAPLLGLLGTVTGMINTFNMITVYGTGDPRTLAGGISEALITTEFGLIVAVPALLLHAFLNRKAKGVLNSMEQTTVAFINGVPDPSEERSEYAGNTF
ncbi:MAG TPA: MotA/TolQ/ExbB proton channel family protein [Methylomirabilota bacterium]|nr:MotA/TolQ/ExbB proton channel family protein [Methylomirabilota bacterium]